MEVPPVIIHFHWIFHELNHPAIGVASLWNPPYPAKTVQTAPSLSPATSKEVATCACCAKDAAWNNVTYERDLDDLVLPSLVI